MISHEMRAPLLSMIYFLEQIMSILIASRPASESLAQAKHYNDIMMSQFSFIGILEIVMRVPNVEILAWCYALHVKVCDYVATAKRRPSGNHHSILQ